MKRLYENEDGVVGPVIMFVLGLAVLAFMYMVISPIFDPIFNSFTTIQTSTGYITQNSADTMDFIRIAITYTPVFVVLTLLLALFIDANRDKSGVT